MLFPHCSCHAWEFTTCWGASFTDDGHQRHLRPFGKSFCGSGSRTHTVTPTLLLMHFSTLHDSCTACFSFILVSLTALGNLGLRALAGLYKTKSFFFFLSLPFFSFRRKHICQLLHWSLIHKIVWVSGKQHLIKGNISSDWEMLGSAAEVKLNSYLVLWLLVFLPCLF